MLVNFDGPEAVKSTAAHPSKAREILFLFETSMGQGSPSLSTSMGLRDLHPCLRAWRNGQGSPSLSTSMDLGSPSLSTSMEEDLSCPSVFFLIEKIDPLESIFLTRSNRSSSQISHSRM